MSNSVYIPFSKIEKQTVSAVYLLNLTRTLIFIFTRLKNKLFSINIKIKENI